MEKLLADILLVTEVAEVASEADVIAKMTLEAHSSINEAVAEKKRSGMLSGVQWKSLKEFGPPKTDSQDRSDSDLVSSGTVSLDPLKQQAPTSDEDEGQSDDLTDSDESEVGNESHSETDDSSNDADPSAPDDAIDDSVKLRSGTTKSSASAYVSSSKIKRLLDRWEEPISKTDKVSANPRCKHPRKMPYANRCILKRPPMPRFRTFSNSAKLYRTWTIRTHSRCCMDLRLQEMNVFGRHRDVIGD